MVALIRMAAEGSGSAHLDGAHDPPMMAGQRMRFSISRAVQTKDVRHLQAARGLHRFSGLRNLSDGFIEGRGDLGQIQPAHMQIDGSRGRGSVAQK